MYFDAVVTRYETYQAGETVEFNPVGGGGTCFEPVFQTIEEEGIEPQAVVFLTDMYGSFPRQEPSYPVIWVSAGGENAPFGEVISIASA